MSAFLGTRRIATYRRIFLPYDEARAFVTALGLESHREWTRYAAGKIPALGKRPANIPSNPSVVYLDVGWRGIKHWLGTGTGRRSVPSRMVPFQEAREFARRLGLRTQLEWAAYIAGRAARLPVRPISIPARPSVTYRKRGWMGWGDFLGTDNKAVFQRKFLRYTDARIVIRKLGLRNIQEWRQWARSGSRPDDIPSNPEKTYRGRWRGWRDFLGWHPRR